MKNRLSSLLAVASLAALPLAVTAAPKTAVVHEVSRVEDSDQAAVARGAAESAVLQSLGEPADKLSPDTWVYPNFSGSEQNRQDDSSTLLVTFAQGQVSDLKLVNERALQVYETDPAAAAIPAAETP